MGWASGTEVMMGLIEVAQEVITDDDERKIFYRKTVKLLREHDWDCLDEPLGEDDMYDEVYQEMFPDGDLDEVEDSEVDVVEKLEKKSYESWTDYSPEDGGGMF